MVLLPSMASQALHCELPSSLEVCSTLHSVLLLPLVDFRLLPFLMAPPEVHLVVFCLSVVLPPLSPSVVLFLLSAMLLPAQFPLWSLPSVAFLLAPSFLFPSLVCLLPLILSFPVILLSSLILLLSVVLPSAVLLVALPLAFLPLAGLPLEVPPLSVLPLAVPPLELLSLLVLLLVVLLLVVLLLVALLLAVLLFVALSLADLPLLVLPLLQHLPPSSLLFLQTLVAHLVLPSSVCPLSLVPGKLVSSEHRLALSEHQPLFL